MVRVSIEVEYLAKKEATDGGAARGSTSSGVEVVDYEVVD
jgi:hypothetical protein